MEKHDAFLERLELNVRTELTEAQSSDAPARPRDEWMFDPADAEREEPGLRSLLGAVEALESPNATACSRSPYSAKAEPAGAPRHPVRLGTP
jgi:hypothetical protein